MSTNGLVVFGEGCVDSLCTEGTPSSAAALPSVNYAAPIIAGIWDTAQSGTISYKTITEPVTRMVIEFRNMSVSPHHFMRVRICSCAFFVRLSVFW